MITKEILLKHGFKQQYFWGAKINYFVKNKIVFSTHNQQIETDKPNEFVCECDNLEDLKRVYQEKPGEELQEINYPIPSPPCQPN